MQPKGIVYNISGHYGWNAVKLYWELYEEVQILGICSIKICLQGYFACLMSFDKEHRTYPKYLWLNASHNNQVWGKYQ